MKSVFCVRGIFATFFAAAVFGVPQAAFSLDTIALINVHPAASQREPTRVLFEFATCYPKSREVTAQCVVYTKGTNGAAALSVPQALSYELLASKDGKTWQVLAKGTVECKDGGLRMEIPKEFDKWKGVFVYLKP